MMAKKDTFDMTPEEWAEHIRELREETERDPQAAMEKLIKGGDLVNLYLTANPDLGNAPHIEQSKRNFYDFAKNEAISPEKRIQAISRKIDEFDLMRVELRARNKISGTIVSDQKQNRYHLKEIDYHISHLEYLRKFLMQRKAEPVSNRSTPQAEINKEMKELKLDDVLKAERKEELYGILEANEVINTRSMKPCEKYNQPGLLCGLLKTLQEKGWTIPEFNGKNNPGAWIIANTFGIPLPAHATFNNAECPPEIEKLL